MTLRIWGLQTETESVFTLPYMSGSLAVGAHEEAGLRAAVGIFDRDSGTENDVDILVWELLADDENPRFSLTVPGLCKLHSLSWDEPAERLRVLAAVLDRSRPLAPNNDPASPKRLVLLEFDLRRADNVSKPAYLSLPPSYDEALSWDIADNNGFALSANGLWLACRTEYSDAVGNPRYGVGVWSTGAGAWEHRFGGCETQPHNIRAVTSDGGCVFTSRQDDPTRDTKYGGAEWYDGLYLWDVRTAQPERTKEAVPETTLHGGRGLILNRNAVLLANPAGVPGTVEIFDSKTAALLRTIRRPPTDD